MTGFDIILKALKRARWIPRKLTILDNRNWCIFPKHYFRRKGGSNFLLRCNDDTKYFNDLSLFYKKILDFFIESNTLYWYDQKQGLALVIKIFKFLKIICNGIKVKKVSI